MARVALSELRRLAPRVKRLAERRTSEAPVVAMAEATLSSAVDRFLATYDRALRVRGAWKRATERGHPDEEAEYQQSLAEVRREARGFHAAMMAYRRALVALLGRGDDRSRAAMFEGKQASLMDAGAA